MKRIELVNYLNRLLEIDKFQDYVPNGLQVEGSENIQKIIFGVTASQELIEQAIAKNADAIIVHHGYFWKSEPITITGIKYQRIKKLIENNINLLAYHLPLDAHADLGNNAQLGKLWNLTDITHEVSPQPDLVRVGKLAQPNKIEDFIATVSETLNRAPLHLAGGKDLVETIAWCSGGAQGYIQQAADFGADVYISGEVSEPTMHIAKEAGIHYLAAGHHATETWGVQALCEHLIQKFADKFGLECEFIDCPNPV